MRLHDRDQVIAKATEHVLAARVGKPECLGAVHMLSDEKTSAYIENLKTRRHPNEWAIRTFQRHLELEPPPSGWSVYFFLHDARYPGGFTFATVIIDDETGEIELRVSQ